MLPTVTNILHTFWRKTSVETREIICTADYCFPVLKGEPRSVLSKAVLLSLWTVVPDAWKNYAWWYDLGYLCLGKEIMTENLIKETLMAFWKYTNIKVTVKHRLKCPTFAMWLYFRVQLNIWNGLRYEKDLIKSFKCDWISQRLAWLSKHSTMWSCTAEVPNQRLFGRQ